MAGNAEEKIQVLIVDDIPETRENLRKLLYFENDIEIVGAAVSGEEGIQMAQELQPHIVLMDINMPGIDGITATEAISHEVPTAQVIMMSVQGEADYLRRSMLAGAREFLIKPFSSDELVSSIRRVYELGAAHRARYQAPAPPFAVAAQRQPLPPEELGAAHRARYPAPRFRFSRSASRIVSTIQSLEELQDFERLEAYDKKIELGRAMDRLERIISGIPHDLKEPLGVARNILNELSEISSPVIGAKDIVYCKDRLDYALLQVNRLISVTSCGQLEVRTETSLTEVLELARSLIKSNFQSAVHIDIDIKPENLRIQVKDSDLQQIIVCLLENAIEATPADRPVRVVIRGHSTKKDHSTDDCEIKVLDVGNGLKGPNESLWDLGYTTKSDHAGIGLFVCKRIVTQYSGIVSVLGRADAQGVIARVVLPQKFKQRKTKYEIGDLKKALRKHRNLSSPQEEEDAVRDVITQILTVFVAKVSSIVQDVESVISPVLKQMAQHTDKERVPLLRTVLRMLKQMDQHADEKQVSQLRTVLRNCAYAEAVVRSLLEPSHPVQIQHIHLRTALFDVLRLFETKLPEKSVSLSIDNRIWVRADQTQFQRVFFNLARNALEAMRLQGEFELSVEAHVENDLAVIRFRDSGEGIPPDNLNKIFDRGFSTKERGRGLGLFVAKTIVELHQGRIEVQSKRGVGTCFTVYWPVASQPADSVAVYPVSEVLTGQVLFKLEEATDGVAACSTATPIVLEGAQILIVDDELDWLDILTRGLQPLQIHKTQTAQKAIELVQENRYDLVLLDWRMPGVGGQGILEAAQEANPDIPIIILSAYGDAEQRSRALRLGAKAFIDKPQNKKQWDTLKHKVFEIVANK